MGLRPTYDKTTCMSFVRTVTDGHEELPPVWLTPSRALQLGYPCRCEDLAGVDV